MQFISSILSIVPALAPILTVSYCWRTSELILGTVLGWLGGFVSGGIVVALVLSPWLRQLLGSLVVLAAQQDNHHRQAPTIRVRHRRPLHLPPED